MPSYDYNIILYDTVYDTKLFRLGRRAKHFLKKKDLSLFNMTICNKVLDDNFDYIFSRVIFY
jgi:hypothetical protein